MIIDTTLDIAHLELLRVFMKANDLDIYVNEANVEIRGKSHKMIRLESAHEPAIQALTFLGLKHAGVLNMFDDFLLKCGVGVTELQPVSYYRQSLEEKDAAINQRFMDSIYSPIKEPTQNEHSNN